MWEAQKHAPFFGRFNPENTAFMGESPNLTPLAHFARRWTLSANSEDSAAIRSCSATKPRGTPSL